MDLEKLSVCRKDCYIHEEDDTRFDEARDEQMIDDILSGNETPHTKEDSL